MTCEYDLRLDCRDPPHLCGRPAVWKQTQHCGWTWTGERGTRSQLLCEEHAEEMKQTPGGRESRWERTSSGTSY